MVLHHVVQVSDASERQVAHMRAQAATSSGQHVEALCKAQDICSQAESKADAADRYMTYFTTICCNAGIHAASMYARE